MALRSMRQSPSGPKTIFRTRALYLLGIDPIPGSGGVENNVTGPVTLVGAPILKLGSLVQLR
jgi:hypothetical protein